MHTETVTQGKGTTMSGNAIRIVDQSSVAPGLFSMHLDLPGEKVNKFSTSFTQEMKDTLDGLAKRTDIKCLVVVSEKEGIFIAGADIELIRAMKTKEDG